MTKLDLIEELYTQRDYVESIEEYDDITSYIHNLEEPVDIDVFLV
nr:MAG: hypothetical protein [Caudoviricetes sp.]